MSETPLHRLATAAGLSIDWLDADARPQRVSDEVLRAVLAGLGLPAGDDGEIQASLERLDGAGHQELPPLLTGDQHRPFELGNWFAPGTDYRLALESGERREGRLDEHGRLPGIGEPGYHQLQVDARSLTLAVAPAACPSVLELAGGPCWGLTVQLYSLRRPGDGGLGDTLALEAMARNAAAHGADALGISPVHAMFSEHLNHYSPYSPSSRLFFNVLHSAPEAILGERALRQAIERCGLEAELLRLEELELVDWPGVARARQCLLRALYEDFSQGGNALQADFDSFRAAGGEALEDHCRFEALHAALTDAEGYPQHWRNWPEAYRDPRSAAVQRFAEEQAGQVRFHVFAQWLMARGLERAQVAATSAGMRIGLVSDLAVGADGSGSQAWSRQGEVLDSLSIGAPPDILNRAGQNWGLAAFSPTGLRRHGYRAFIEMLRANLAHAGGMRIDHVMGLMRLWVMPAGADPQHGAYLNYPFDDLLRLLSLEAWRHRAVILGEDLGTVPHGLRDKLAERNILGMRVLLFERDGQSYFFPAAHWSDRALATSTTHDIPTLHGWWQGHDIDWRIRVGQVGEASRDDLLQERDRERAGLNRTLREDAGKPGEDLLSVDEAVDAAACFLGHTPAPLVLLPVEDALGLAEQTNMPGIVDKHPNWRRRYPGDSASLLDGEPCNHRLDCLRQARQQSRGSHA
ncbi:4-alpha-glucanotransferase [Pseudomonas oligotrophica]|uniref:4-alpha-glucanotransferase n=1 Tax=Pseudomonas oligotrophica TaxID=2912055 RepID=UPI001EFFBF49|nr:4-alpha-glucanotransferase [Pseudomonas oligotrophica]MCF7202492.1 4-alpha-glucanotransferase [Pseudomonas oligotrophica]